MRDLSSQLFVEHADQIVDLGLHLASLAVAYAAGTQRIMYVEPLDSSFYNSAFPWKAELEAECMQLPLTFEKLSQSFSQLPVWEDPIRIRAT
jgi:hypothetical protein